MKTYDWIVVGGGITGAALSYELARKGFAVLAIERDQNFQNATRYSYGALPFSAGTTDLTQQLFKEGIARHRHLSSELDVDTQFRELDLLLTIAADENPEIVAATYSNFAIPPRLLSKQAATEIEPLLNQDAIAGALILRYGHICPESTNRGYCQAAKRNGGKIEFGEVAELVKEGDRVIGVRTKTVTYTAANVVICAGGFSRLLLTSAGIPTRVYFTHAEMLETPPVELKLRTLVMPAVEQRFNTEAVASQTDLDKLWSEGDREISPPALDAGAIQFRDGSIRIGQISRTLSNPRAEVDAARSEAAMREAIAKVLPALENLPAIWHHCLVAFSRDSLPLIGGVPNMEGLYIFSGFSGPMLLVPPLAKRFADFVAGEDDEILRHLSPARFG